MSALSPLRSLPSEAPVVRQRCLPCEVAWSGPAGTPCWVCGEDGIGLRSVLPRTDDELLALDFAAVR